MNGKTTQDMLDNLYDWYKYDDKQFEELFPILPGLIYEKSKSHYGEIYPDVYTDPKTFYKDIDVSLKYHPNKVSVYGTLGLCIKNRTDMEYYSQFINYLFTDYPFAKLYFNSKYREKDMITLSMRRIDEILQGVEIPPNIVIEYDYDGTNGLYDKPRHYLSEVDVYANGNITKIKSEMITILSTLLQYDADYTSGPRWNCTFKNEQLIRRTIKQFIEDMR